MTILEAKRETRLAVWQRHIQDQRRSGLTVRAWCAQNGCSEKSYYYWLRLVRERMLEQAAGSTLVQVRPEALVSASITGTCSGISGSVIIRFGNACIAAGLEEGTRLNTSIVKQLCSTDAVFAEKKYKDPFSFTPSHIG